MPKRRYGESAEVPSRSIPVALGLVGVDWSVQERVQPALGFLFARREIGRAGRFGRSSEASAGSVGRERGLRGGGWAGAALSRRG
jgi:hypothetical protein